MQSCFQVFSKQSGNFFRPRGPGAGAAGNGKGHREGDPSGLSTGEQGGFTMMRPTSGARRFAYQKYYAPKSLFDVSF